MTHSPLPSVFGTGAKPSLGINSLHKEIERVFDEFRSAIPSFNNDESLDGTGKIVPKIDIRETDDSVVFSAELPGVAEKDIDVSVSGNVLTLTGEKSSHREENEKDYKLVERSYGSFARSFPLAFDIDADSVSAKFDNGVLDIAVKKPAEIAPKTKSIKISKAK
ncbi:Hsp20 family protein [Pseudahrensia aquimaris]|uniref:Hsp20 family protein n=1 Tax=Pseudahrensia aquimaris TaxID=744461 RepID=A0ABW3F8P7_9HYPH